MLFQKVKAAGEYLLEIWPITLLSIILIVGTIANFVQQSQTPVP